MAQQGCQTALGSDGFWNPDLDLWRDRAGGVGVGEVDLRVGV